MRRNSTLIVNVAEDDWDGKTKDENMGNPHWKNHCDGDPKYFFGDKVSNSQDAVNSYFAGTLTNDSVENFETQWYNNEDIENDEGNKDVPIPELDPKKMEKLLIILFEIGVGAQTNSLQRIWNFSIKSCRLKKERQKPITHKA
jgi:hypothetical protein